MTTTRTQTLCVALDSSRIRADLRWERFARLIAPNPLRAVRVGLLRLAGRPKPAPSGHVDILSLSLPMNPQIVSYVRDAQRSGGRTVLVTASASNPPHDIAQVLDAFSDVMSTGLPDGSGSGEAGSGEAMAQTLVEKFGEGRFTYLGGSREDLVVWRHSEAAVTLDAPADVLRDLDALGIPHEDLRTPGASLATWARLLRVHQWIKNVLVFVPLIVSWRDRTLVDVVSAVILFAAFCLLASAVYVFNDIGDLGPDRRHLTKRNRPIASGAISVRAALTVSIALAAAAFVVASFVNPLALAVLALYGAATIGYSASFKKIAIGDVIVLAGLYTVRVIAGCAALLVIPSIWLILFSVFIFFSLALMKRCADFANQDASLTGRGYVASDEVLLVALGTSSGLVSVMVLGLYINSFTSSAEYRTPALLWLDVPLLLFWISRAWLITHRGNMQDDPVVFALHDRASQVAGTAMILIAVLATVVSL